MLGAFTIQVLLDHIINNERYTTAFPKVVRGTPGAPVPPQNWFDCTKSLKTLNIQPTHERKTA